MNQMFISNERRARSPVDENVTLEIPIRVIAFPTLLQAAFQLSGVSRPSIQILAFARRTSILICPLLYSAEHSSGRKVSLPDSCYYNISLCHSLGNPSWVNE